jgi:hypothetical protein
MKNFMKNRSTKYRAFALIENRTSKIAVIDHRVPVFWIKSMAERERDKYNSTSGRLDEWLRVESVIVEREEKRNAKEAVKGRR